MANTCVSPEHNVSTRMECMEVWGGNHFTTRNVEFGGLDCWIYSKPHGDADCGGDVYYASSCATGRIIRLLLADIAGHGNAVARIAGDLRSLMRRFVNRLDHAEFVHLLNDQFAATSPDDIFATALVATFFAPSRRLRLCNAGHPRPFLFRVTTGKWQVLSNESMANLPLGIFPHSLYEHFDIELQPGDCVLAYTDALCEANDCDGEELGESGLLQLLNRMGHNLDPAKLIQALKQEVAQRHPANLCKDDLTLLFFRANGREMQFPLGQRLRAVGRFIAALFAAIDPRAERPPFPDLMLANIGGALIPALGRRWRAPGL